MSEIPKKILIPIIVAAILLICLIGGLVYRSTSSSPFEEEKVQQTIAPTTQAVIETKVAGNTPTAGGDTIKETELPVDHIIGDDGEELTGDEAEAYAESFADTLTVTESVADDGTTYLVNSDGAVVSEVLATDFEAPAVAEVGDETTAVRPVPEGEDIDQFNEAMGNAIDAYTAQQAKENLRKGVILTIPDLIAQGYEGFDQYTEEYLQNASDEEIERIQVEIIRATLR